MVGPAAEIEGPAARFGRSLAVVIGIDNYGDGIPRLQSAVADAKAIGEALERDHGFETWCLFDVPLARLLAVLRDELPAALGSDDRLLLYFAGHGIALDSDAGPAGYLLPAGARRDDRDGFLPMQVLHHELCRIPVRHALVILDCCFAGSFRWSSLRDVELSAAKIYRERYDRYVESAAWQVLTSTSADQLALDRLADDRGEGGGTHSPFALALLEGLGGRADLTGDNLIPADELAVFVRAQVAPAAESVGRRQVPQLFPLDRHDAGQFVFQVPNQTLALVPAPPLDENASPYRGLESFREEDRELFFGREVVTKRLVDAVVARRLTVVVGPSGSGKSSVVHAGLVPALRARGWTVLPTQRPGREPLAALDAWARALGRESGGGDPVAAWAAAVAGRAGDSPWLVVVDQLEELLTHRTTERDRAAFLGALAAALETAPSLHVVVTVRSDAEPQFHDTALGPWWTAGRFGVPGMTRDELRQIIERPATAAVLCFEPSRLVERLLDDVALVPAPLPLLSFALSELYRRCWTRWLGGTRDRELREADYDEMGSVARALTQRATALHDQLVAEDAAYGITIRNVFTRMVAVVSGDVARRRVPRDELVYGEPAEDRRVGEVLQRFHDARLISLGTEEAGDGGVSAHVEPTHDELVRGWTQVSRWLDELDSPTGTRALFGALGSAVRSWQEGKQTRTLLWSDPRVELARALARERPFAFNAREALFVESSTRLRRDRMVRLIGGLAAVICVLAVAAGVALWQRGIAVDNAGQAAASEAETKRQLALSYQEAGRKLLLDGHPQEAMPYLVAARQEGVEGAPLRMLFWTAIRSLPIVPPLEHQEVVMSAAFSPDGTRVVTASHDHTARIWDAATGKLLASPLVHQGWVMSAAFSADGTRVVTSSVDLTARIWDAATGKLLASPLVHKGSVMSAAFSPDGTRIVTASGDHAVRIWDAATGKMLVTPLQHRDAVYRAEFSPDGTRVVTASRDNTARIWDAATGKLLVTPLQHRDAVYSAEFSSDGTRVITASSDGRARIWDAATGNLLAPPLEHQGGVVRAAFSADGTRVVTASQDKTARIWDAATGKLLAPPLEHQSNVSSAAFSPDGTRVVTASADHTARVWDAVTGKPVTISLEHQSSVSSATFSPDGTRVVTASADHTARVWDAATGKFLSTPLEYQEVVNSATFSPDGIRVVTASNDQTARVWDAATGKPISSPLVHQSRLSSATFSPDGTRVATVSDDQTVRVWDVATGEPLTTLVHRGPVANAAFSPDGSRVATASNAASTASRASLASASSDGTASIGGTACVWDAVTGKPVTSPLEHLGSVSSVAFSPDGTHVVTASSDKTARVWDAATGKPLNTLLHQGFVSGAAFSADGSRIVTASHDHSARIWDAASGRPLGTPLMHSDIVSSAAFSPDGTRVVTASHDYTARIWDAATGKPIASPLVHQGLVSSATFSSDSTRVVTASWDNTARVWDAATGMLLATLIEYGEAVKSAAFSPDGTRIVTVNDNTARIWETRLDQVTLAEWFVLAERSPFMLSDGVIAPRPPRDAEPDATDR